MSSKRAKGHKGKKAKAGEAGVMGSLPSTRPARIGAPRGVTPVKPAAVRRVSAKPASAKPVTAPQPAADTAPPTPARTPDPPATAQSGTVLVGTVVQAAGELAQIGLTVSGQVLKRAIGRLPRP